MGSFMVSTGYSFILYAVVVNLNNKTVKITDNTNYNTALAFA